MIQERRRLTNRFCQIVFVAMFVALSSSTAQAARLTVDYVLDNVFQTNGQQMTGTFQWVYNDGDFENGTGTFSELFIPGHGTNIDALNINFDVNKSIEFSLKANLQNQGVDVTLFFLSRLSLTLPSLIDTSRSVYNYGGGFNGSPTSDGFSRGSIVPVATGVVPVPAAVWLFGSGLIGLFGFARYRF